MARTPQEIFQHHGGALVAGDLDVRVTDGIDTVVFSDDAIRAQIVRCTPKVVG